MGSWLALSLAVVVAAVSVDVSDGVGDAAASVHSGILLATNSGTNWRQVSAVVVAAALNYCPDNSNLTQRMMATAARMTTVPPKKNRT